MADKTADNAEHHEDGVHEIAGMKVGERGVPFSAIMVFLFILSIALISWIATTGY